MKGLAVVLILIAALSISYSRQRENKGRRYYSENRFLVPLKTDTFLIIFLSLCQRKRSYHNKLVSNLLW